MQLSVNVDLATYYALIEDELARVKKYINEQFITSNISIIKLMEYLKLRQGKMLRPSLLLLSGKACGNLDQLHIQLAAIVEMIHTATLFHDDVLDEAEKRRGMSTVNNLRGNEFAVLLGDFLLSKISGMLAQLGNSEIEELVARTTLRICEGELRQNVERKNWALSESEYISIIADKTASLFKFCCYIGGFVAGANEEELIALSDFGLNVGIAFQIIDDISDITADENQVGKTLGSDFNEGKPTLPIIHLFGVLSKNNKSLLIKRLNNGLCNATDISSMLENNGSLLYAQKQVEQYYTTAVKSLENLEETNAKNSLIQIAEFMIDRTV